MIEKLEIEEEKIPLGNGVYYTKTIDISIEQIINKINEIINTMVDLEVRIEKLEEILK